MKRLQIELEDSLMAKLKARAKRNKMTLSEYIETIYRFYDKFDVGLLSGLDQFYRDSGTTLSLSQILQRLAVMVLAQRDAERDAEIKTTGVAEPILLIEAADDGLHITDFYKVQYDNEFRQCTADYSFDKKMKELNKYKQPGEHVTIQELQRRKNRADFVKRFPDKANLYDRTQAEQKKHKRSVYWEGEDKKV